jgi:hypothetical protein
VISEMISDACRQVDGSLTCNHKFDLVYALVARGVFLARGSVQRVASAWGIAVPTIYKYIQQGRRHQPTAKTIRKGWKAPTTPFRKRCLRLHSAGASTRGACNRKR